MNRALVQKERDLLSTTLKVRAEDMIMITELWGMVVALKRHLDFPSYIDHCGSAKLLWLDAHTSSV